MTTLGLGLGSAIAPLGGAVTSNITFLTQIYADLSDGAVLPEILQVGLPATAADTARLRAVPAPVRAAVLTVSDTLNLTPQASAAYSERVFELLRVARTTTTNMVGGATASDSVRLADALYRGLVEVLADSVEVTPSLSVVAAVAVLEALGLGETLLGSKLLGAGLVDRLSISEALGRFFGGDITDAVQLADVLASTGLLSSVLTDAVDVSTTAAARLVLRVTLAEDVDISAAQGLQLFFSPEILETIQLDAGYVAPDGSFTAWAMNTRTAAVTEYDNYEFNSFGVLAGRSIGATSDGLYELVGADDAGDAIIARIKSGFMQFGGTKLSRLKAAYIATRGEGDFVLRIETGQGEVYDYEVATRNMRSTKVHMGKGQRARYFSFELTSAGADFDIDTIEFVPVVVDRRV